MTEKYASFELGIIKMLHLLEKLRENVLEKKLKLALCTLFKVNSNTDISKIRLEGLRDRNMINQLILHHKQWKCLLYCKYNIEEITNYAFAC